MIVQPELAGEKSAAATLRKLATSLRALRYAEVSAATGVLLSIAEPSRDRDLWLASRLATGLPLSGSRGS